MTEIVLSLCTLRPLRPTDAASIAQHANNRNVSRNLRDEFPYPYSIADGEAWISSCEADDPPLNFAIVVGDDAVGAIGLIPDTELHARSMEIGYWLGEEFWGRGIATEALIAFTAHAFPTFGVDRLWAGVYVWNPASVRVLEKAGYEFEGRHRNAIFKDGEVADELIYAKVR